MAMIPLLAVSPPSIRAIVPPVAGPRSVLFALSKNDYWNARPGILNGRYIPRPLTPQKSIEYFRMANGSRLSFDLYACESPQAAAEISVKTDKMSMVNPNWLRHNTEKGYPLGRRETYRGQPDSRSMYVAAGRWFIKARIIHSNRKGRPPLRIGPDRRPPNDFAVMEGVVRSLLGQGLDLDSRARERTSYQSITTVFPEARNVRHDPISCVTRLTVRGKPVLLPAASPKIKVGEKWVDIGGYVGWRDSRATLRG